MSRWCNKMTEPANRIMEEFERAWNDYELARTVLTNKEIARAFYYAGIEDTVDRFEEILIETKLIKPKSF